MQFLIDCGGLSLIIFFWGSLIATKKDKNDWLEDIYRISKGLKIGQPKRKRQFS